MADISALTAAEHALLAELERRGVRFIIVGLAAAISLQGANMVTQDIDLWFENTSGSFGMRPPEIGGAQLGDGFDVVTHMHGLGRFADEVANSLEIVVDGTRVRVLKLERIIASKRAAGRSKDLAVIPALEEALGAIEANRGA